ncbi:hypothetical protein ACE1SV_73290 [Streptomyces sp. E-15]
MLTHRVDTAGDLVPRGHREGEAGQVAADHQGVGVAHTACLDRDTNLEGPGIGDVAPAHTERTFGLVYQDRSS